MATVQRRPTVRQKKKRNDAKGNFRTDRNVTVKAFKPWFARHASRWRSTRHIAAHLQFPGMEFHEALTRVTYKRIFGVWPDLDDPRTISEKMCWLKINDRRAICGEITDKYRMRGYAERLGLAAMLNDLHGVWESAAEVDFHSLPDCYALKVTNGSAWNVIKRPGVPIDEESARRRLDRWMKTNMADHKGEWYYAASPARIIAEHYLDNGDGDIPDYKLFVFNGKTRIVQYCTGRYQNLRSIFMSPDWEPMPFSYKVFKPYGAPPPRPAELDQMIAASHRLAAGFPLVRVDFYVHQGRLLLGEMSLNPVGGYTVFRPEEWNLEIGDWLELPDAAELRNRPACPGAAFVA
ncbi:MAG: ATP-grasp fold amidoligase family protein [Parvibaculum sp.]|uniref:ATP-grasp fold amidoligase family protein n=1 Tax=Parvibaculum sp. TaxID=2024848 RepID=UPI002AB9A63E|nr:ATP-grasp fold amidoligase family protein [Parvibaculum sp.]MDZ4381611.1 ATP-grasp fold amidoligase family protein [Parvibaculum sp.]